MYEIQANAKGSRLITVTDEHLKTIKKYALFRSLVDRNGIIDETVLDKLRLNVRDLIDTHLEDADLLDLCRNVLFHNDMKAYGLGQLVQLYVKQSDVLKGPDSEPVEAE
ncbi:MAG: hypothetical protein LUC45_06105 [Paraprevotella sp.]|nr:hypothetical protein [Paraprevotella sp.]